MKRIFILISALVLGLALISDGGVVIDRIVAIVNNEAITLSELQKAVSMEAREALKGLSEEKKTEAEERLRREMLNGLIERRLQLQMAKRSGIGVTNEEVKGAIEEIKKKNSLDDAGLEKALAKENMTLKEYEDQLRDQMAVAKLINQDVRSRVIISDKEIEAYYEKNRGNYSFPERVRVSHIFLKLSEKAAEKDIDEIRKMTEKITEKLRAGMDFGEVARTYSQGPTATAGGELGIIKKGEMAPELEEVAFSLEEGEVSGPVWTKGGVHILKIKEKVGSQSMSLEDVREDIRKALTEAETERRYKEWIKGLRENSFIEIKW